MSIGVKMQVEQGKYLQFAGQFEASAGGGNIEMDILLFMLGFYEEAFGIRKLHIGDAVLGLRLISDWPPIDSKRFVIGATAMFGAANECFSNGQDGGRRRRNQQAGFASPGFQSNATSAAQHDFWRALGDISMDSLSAPTQGYNAALLSKSSRMQHRRLSENDAAACTEVGAYIGWDLPSWEDDAPDLGDGVVGAAQDGATTVLSTELFALVYGNEGPTVFTLMEALLPARHLKMIQEVEEVVGFLVATIEPYGDGACEFGPDGQPTEAQLENFESLRECYFVGWFAPGGFPT
jgi:hypothetical protein